MSKSQLRSEDTCLQPQRNLPNPKTCDTLRRELASPPQWLRLLRSFHKELAQHESRSAAEVEALKKSNAQADDELGRSVEAIVAQQAQLRGDARAQQDSMRTNEAAILRLQSEARCCSMACRRLSNASPS